MNLQILQAHERVFAGDLRRQLVEEIRPLAGDPLVDLRDPSLCLAQPVRGLQPEPLREGFLFGNAGGDFRSFDLAGDGPLVATQPL